jgi:hypothetical protein
MLEASGSRRKEVRRKFERISKGREPRDGNLGIRSPGHAELERRFVTLGWLRRASPRLMACAATCLSTVAPPISGQSPGATVSSAPSDQETTIAPPEPGKFTLGGYLETFWSYNFNHPSNRITNFRGFDNRESTFAISNAVVSGAWEKAAVSGKITAQAGITPNTYYLAEPAAAGTSSTGTADATTTWKYLQEAWIGYRAPIGRGVLFQTGIFLSPIGVENMPVKDNWNWSRSNLFFGLPFYHAGIKATYELSKSWTAELMVCNGWNDIVDNNRQKSLELSATYKASDTLSLHLLYFGGRRAVAQSVRRLRHMGRDEDALIYPARRRGLREQQLRDERLDGGRGLHPGPALQPVLSRGAGGRLLGARGFEPRGDGERPVLAGRPRRVPDDHAGLPPAEQHLRAIGRAP